MSNKWNAHDTFYRPTVHTGTRGNSTEVFISWDLKCLSGQCPLRSRRASGCSCLCVWACAVSLPAADLQLWESPSWEGPASGVRGSRPAAWPVTSSPPWDLASAHRGTPAAQSLLARSYVKKRLNQLNKDLLASNFWHYSIFSALNDLCTVCDCSL